ncbi:MAG: GHKL domain-containing protein [Oscillospiraceae bacterium]|jgi:nitrogen-specific signal transduction histidine kinase|nr:GHKL domain-containing protein [Oscillospiraceae bacterium]
MELIRNLLSHKKASAAVVDATYAVVFANAAAQNQISIGENIADKLSVLSVGKFVSDIADFAPDADYYAYFYFEDKPVPCKVTPFKNGDEQYYIVETIYATDIPALLSQTSYMTHIKTYLFDIKKNVSKLLNKLFFLEKKNHKSMSYDINQLMEMSQQTYSNILNLTEFVGDYSPPPPEPEITNIKRELSDIVAICKERIPNKSFEFVLDTRIPDYSLGVAINPSRFSLLIMNLIRNAYMYSPSKAEITLTLNADKEFITLTLANNVDKSKQQSECGLGLAATNEIVQSVGGSLEINLDKKIYTANLKLPVFKEDVKLLKSPLLSYHNLRLSIVNIFLTY